MERFPKRDVAASSPVSRSMFIVGYPTRRESNRSASSSSRNRFTRFSDPPVGSRSPRSHRANVPRSTPRRLAASFCETPKLVRRRTSHSPQPFAAGSGL